MRVEWCDRASSRVRCGLARIWNRARIRAGNHRKIGGCMVHIGVEEVTRRGFLKGMLGAGAFVLSLRMMPGNAPLASLSEEMAGGGLKGPLSPNVWLEIDTDGAVYIIAHRSEMGSGSRTAVP